MNERFFSRNEGKFFVPGSKFASFQTQLEQSLESAFERESFPNPVTRTVYFFTDIANNFPYGFSIRYRDYSTKPITAIAPGQGCNGRLDIKFESDQRGSQRKQKIRLDFPYSEKILTQDLVEAIRKTGFQGETESAINTLQEVTSQSATLYPLIAVEYTRARYKEKENPELVCTVDSPVFFYRFLEGQFLPTGSFEGGIIEIKDGTEDEDVQVRDIYRLLVKSDAHRFYSKKGQALSLYKHSLKGGEGLPPAISEAPGLEIELKMDIDPERYIKAIGEIHRYYNDGRSMSGYRLSPYLPHIDSDSSINYYYYDPNNLDQETKMMVRLGTYKITTKNLVDRQGPVLVREEDKGKWVEYSREKARKEEKGHLSGKAVRTRRSIAIISPDNRLFKICVDLIEAIPFSKGQKFSQLEIEYIGRLGLGRGTTSVNPKQEIIDDLLDIQKDIKLILEENLIQSTPGARKVDMFA